MLTSVLVFTEQTAEYTEKWSPAKFVKRLVCVQADKYVYWKLQSS